MLDVARQALAAGVARALRHLRRLPRGERRRARTLEEELLALVRCHGARLIGPNCLGITAAADAPERDVRAQRRSRSATSASARRAARSGWRSSRRRPSASLGLSSFVSVGNKADVSSNDLLEYWEDDDATKLILLYLESFGNPRKFGAARPARRARRSRSSRCTAARAPRARAPPARTPPRSPRARTRCTRSSARPASSRRETLEELIDAAALLTSQPLPAGRRVAILTNAGGLGVLCADACAAAGLDAGAARGRTTLAALGRAAAGADRRRRTRSTCSAPRRRRSTARRSTPLLDDPERGCGDRPLRAAGERDERRGRGAAARGARGARRATKPVLGVLFDDGSAREELRGTVTRLRLPRLGRACARARGRRAPSGSPSRPARSPSPTGSTARPPRRSSSPRSRTATRWLDPSETHALLAALRAPASSRRSVCADAPTRRWRPRARARLPGRPQDGRGRARTRARAAASCSGSRARRTCAKPSPAIGGPVLVQPQVAAGGRRAPRRRGAGRRASARSSPPAPAACSPS